MQQVHKITAWHPAYKDNKLAQHLFERFRRAILISTVLLWLNFIGWVVCIFFTPLDSAVLPRQIGAILATLTIAFVPLLTSIFFKLEKEAILGVTVKVK